jgi:tRNA(Ile)-lysidine synthase
MTDSDDVRSMRLQRISPYVGSIKMADKFENKVKDFIDKYKMIVEQDKIIIGVSGGADSVCLLFVLKSLMTDLDFTIIVAHVNHGLRGEQACRDEEFVKELSKRLGLPCYTTSVDVQGYAKEKKLSIEEAGRVLRREYFQKLKGKTKGNKIALGHHQNDNVETLLMNLARGSGLGGVVGIKPVNEEYIRPLLSVTREEIEDELRKQEITFCSDETNEDNRFTRNRLRNIVMPSLQEVNSKAVTNMNETMNHLREVKEFIDEVVMIEYSRVVKKQKSGVLIGNEKGMISGVAEKEVIQKEIIKKALEEVSGEKRDFSRIHIKKVEELFTKQVGRKIDLPHGLVGVRDYQGVAIYLKGSRDGTLKCNEETVLMIPGITKVPRHNITVECRFIGEDEKSFYKPSHSTYTKSIDYDIMKNGLSIRGREAKDMITINKDGSRQKLKSYFINEKIPSDLRDQIPLLVDGEEVVWVIGYRMNMRYQLNVNTKKILEIKIHKEG